MPREEPRDLVEGLGGLVQFPEVELEDVRALRATCTVTSTSSRAALAATRMAS